MDEVREPPLDYMNASVCEPLGIGLALITERIEASSDNQRWGDA